MAEATYRTDLRGLDEFPASALYMLLKLRCDVFVVEQQCAYADIDGKDIGALHLRLLDGEDLLAAARLLPPHGADDPVKIGRVVVSPDQRGKRLGEALMREAIAACQGHYPGRRVALSAQNHLRQFYEGLGFAAISDVYVEDDIPHVDMIREALSA